MQAVFSKLSIACGPRYGSPFTPLPWYVDAKLLPVDPFVSIDRAGVGSLMKMAADKGRSVKPKLKLGICGEHGGDPESVEFCHTLGLGYVSCSPYRVPIARLAAARACVAEKKQEK